MKKKMFMLCLALVSWGAYAQHDHLKVNHVKKDPTQMESMMKKKSNVPSTIKFDHPQSVATIIDNYLELKNALVEDNSGKAANSGKMLFDALANSGLSAQTESQQKELDQIIKDAKEHADHISENRGDIDHQREHFEILSTDLIDLLVIKGSDRTLYQIFCPMYNNNEGGMWLSASSEIRNPFFGSKMLNCGKIQQEIAFK